MAGTPPAKQRKTERDMALVIELQSKAADSSCPGSELLRLTLITARKLNREDFADWIQKELNGYRDINDVPKYRRVRGLAVVRSLYGQQWFPMVLSNLEKGVPDKLTTMWLPYPISEIENDAARGEDLILSYDEDVEAMLMRGLHGRGQPALKFTSSQLMGIVNAVRNIILEWALSLEQAGVVGEGLTFNQTEKSSVPSLSIETLINQVTNSQIQVRSPGAQQNFQIKGDDLEGIRALITDLLKAVPTLALSEQQKAELKSEADTIYAQCESPKPKPAILSASLSTILQLVQIANASGSLIDRIQQILRHFGFLS